MCGGSVADTMGGRVVLDEPIPDRFRAWPGFCGASVMQWVTTGRRLAIAGAVVLAIALGAKLGMRWWGIRSVMRPAGRRAMCTMTELPRLPAVPWRYVLRNPNEREREQLLRDILDVKMATYPAAAPASARAGKHRTMGFANFEPTQAQIERLAARYDVFYLGGPAAHRIATIKRVNPGAKALMYFACSLTRQSRLHDAGSVDEEDTDWIVRHHADWLLKDDQGRLVQGQSWSAKYWADPGDEEWQAFFARKLNAALEKSGGAWDAVILDEFLTGRSSTAASWAGGGRPQAKYATDKAWQEAQLAFLRSVAPRVSVPIVPNVEPVVLNPTSEGFNPEFFTQVQEIAGGAEVEIFVFHRAHPSGFLGREMVQVYLDRARQTPPGKMMFLNSATATGFGGNPDLTLFSYFTYLLVADPDREIYWTTKEGDSEIPHFWYKEFDLDLGPPQEEMQTAGDIWKRDFVNATVVVNPSVIAAEYAFEGKCTDVLSRPLQSPVTLAPQTAALLIRNPSILRTLK